MKTRLNEQMSEYKSIERDSHVNLEDVINKVTQEICELIESDIIWNKEEIYKEAGDVIANIFSVCYELGIDPVDDFEKTEKNNTKLAILLWKWNSKIQWLRNRFSRDDVNIDEVQLITRDLVKNVLNYSDPNMSLVEIIDRNIKKFNSRKNLYMQKIDVKDYITSFSDFPKSWINFKDISPILKSPEALRFVTMEMVKQCSNSDVIVWLDARGFIFWSLVACELKKPFIMLRKKWKLPGDTNQVSYWLEYGKDTLEIQKWSLEKWQKVAIIDDLLATWWTVKAAIELVESLGWEVDNLSFVISLDEKELTSLESRKQLEWYNINSLASYL